MKPLALILFLCAGCAANQSRVQPGSAGVSPAPLQIQSRSGVLPPPAATLAFLPVPVNLIWNPDDNEVASYNLYYGPESRTYLNSVSAVATNAVLNLRPLQVYYLAVTAVSSDGTESDFSNEIVYQPSPQLIQLHFPEPTAGIQFSTDLVNWVDLPAARQTNGDWFVNAP